MESGLFIFSTVELSVLRAWCSEYRAVFSRSRQDAKSFYSFIHNIRYLKKD